MPSRRSILLGLAASACGRSSGGDHEATPLSASSPSPGGDRAPLRLWIGGDVHLADGGAPLLDPALRARLPGVGLVNLEGAVGQALTTADPMQPRLHNAPGGLSLLRDAGVRVATIANNHARDPGHDAPQRTRDALRAAGLVPAGLDAGRGEIVHEGWRIAVVAHDLGDGPIAASTVREARSVADVLVVTFHVTGPPSYLPTFDLKAAVNIAIAESADVVAAHGTHALAHVERHGDTVVAWGLGNLRFACDCTRERDGLVLAVTMAPNRPIDALAVPIDAGLRGASATPSHDPGLIVELLRSLGSSPLTPRDGGVSF